MQINPLPGVRFMETFFWKSPWPAEALKTVKPFDAIFGDLNPILTRLNLAIIWVTLHQKHPIQNDKTDRKDCKCNFNWLVCASGAANGRKSDVECSRLHKVTGNRVTVQISSTLSALLLGRESSVNGQTETASVARRQQRGRPASLPDSSSQEPSWHGRILRRFVDSKVVGVQRRQSNSAARKPVRHRQ